MLAQLFYDNYFIPAVGTGTSIAVSVSKPSLPTYAVVALGQQQKVFTSNSQVWALIQINAIDSLEMLIWIEGENGIAG